MCGQQNAATVGADQSTILGQRVHGALADRHIEQAVSGNIEGDGAARRKGYRAHPGRYHAVIANSGTQQRNGATIGRYRSLVDNRTCAGIRELVSPRHEVTVGNVQCGGHQSSHVDLSAPAKENAVRIDNEDVAVRTQIAQDGGGLGPKDPIQRDGVAAGLRESDRFAGADAEALPVDHGIRRHLVDDGIACATVDAGTARCHHATRWQCMGAHGKADGHGHAQCGDTAACAALRVVANHERCFVAVAPD